MASREWWNHEGWEGSRRDLTMIFEEPAHCWKACNAGSVVGGHAASGSGRLCRWTGDGYCIPRVIVRRLSTIHTQRFFQNVMTMHSANQELLVLKLLVRLTILK